MNGPTAAELLVQKTQEAERLRVLLIANKCKDIRELQEKLSEMPEESQK